MGKIKVNEIEKHDASEITINDTVKVDTIAEKTSGSGVTVDGLTIKDTGFDEPVKMKSYTDTQMNALSGMGAGDTIYNSTYGTLYVYNGTSWNAMSASTFTFTVNYLVLAGGGSGGGSDGGGGGAGGYRSAYLTESSGGGNSAESALTGFTANTNYSVTVGAGGAANNVTVGANGSDSTFHSITSTGGGRGGGGSGTAPATGGSGGGGDNDVGGGSGHIGAAGTTNQGYAGGNGSNDGGGGGGAGGVGANGPAGNGGVGVASTITGSSVFRGGGGAGGGEQAAHTGGNGGGGDESTSGTANTGGGGGGANDSSAVGSGGSGVVILRYPNSFTIALGAGLTSAAGEQTDGSEKYIAITAGAGNISWS